MNITSITKARLYTFALTVLVMLALMLSACNAPGADEEPSTDGGPMRITTSFGTHPLKGGLPVVLHNLLDTPLGNDFLRVGIDFWKRGSFFGVRHCR